MKKIPVGRFAAFATVAVLVLVASSPAFMNVVGEPETNITFDLNGGTLDGQGSFIRTEGSLVTGLPDVDGAVVPSGKDEFVVWSTSPTSYSQIYNVGDPVPVGITTFYAVWGVNLDVSANMTVSTAECYIVKGGSGTNVTVNSAGALLVLERSNIGTLNISKDVTILLRYAEDVSGNEIKSQANSLTGGSNPFLNMVISSASTGTLNISSSNIWASNFRLDGGTVEADKVTINGTVVVNGGTLILSGSIQGSSVEINGSVTCYNISSNGTVTINGSVNAEKLETWGPVVISGDVDVNGGISGSSIDVSGNVSSDEIDVWGPIVISGDVDVDGGIYGSSINVSGNVTSDEIDTWGPVVISGVVEVEGNVEGSTINVNGGTLIAGSASPVPSVNETAVVIIGGQDIVPAGSEYIRIEPLSSFDTSNISNILVKFKLEVSGVDTDVVLWLPDITDKISLGPNTSLVASGDGKYWMEVLYTLDGKEYVTTGEMIYQSSATPKYYLCEIGEGAEVDPDDEDDLVIISRPSVYDSPVQIYVTPSMTTVRLTVSGNALDITSDSDEIQISVPNDTAISGFWGTWSDLEEDPDGGYVLMDEDFIDSGTFVLFVIIPAPGPDAEYSIITPVCITTVPELSFDN